MNVLEQCLLGVWCEVTGSTPVFDDPLSRTESLWNSGLTSINFVQLLTLVEEGFGFEWDLDESADAVSSFDSLLDSVARHATRLPASHSPAGAG